MANRDLQATNPNLETSDQRQKLWGGSLLVLNLLSMTVSLACLKIGSLTLGLAIPYFAVAPVLCPVKMLLSSELQSPPLLLCCLVCVFVCWV